MKRQFFSLCARAVGCALVLQFPATVIATSKERVILSFDNTTGVFPYAGLINVHGTLYGTASEGGTNCSDYGLGCGTALAVNPKTDVGTVLYTFCTQQNCTDGDDPEANLISVNGTLYGTTYVGGTYCPNNYPPGCGTVFSINPTTGAETVLHSFGIGTDGQYPVAGLIDVKGTLYGTTWAGGTGCYNAYCGQGTVFSIDPNTGEETVVYSFCSQQNCTDGAQPKAGLSNVGGTLYGTTMVGGSYGGGRGTVFSIVPKTGSEKVVHSFGGPSVDRGGADGEYPLGSLINVNGTLYGTTSEGGGANCQNYCGTVFSVNPTTGAETVLHSFGSGADGGYPEASLIDMKGTLYGTTAFGGANCHKHNYAGCGTVFSVNPTTGAESLLHSFCSKKQCADGAYPFTSPMGVKGTLYGTTYGGGTYGDGTVFTVTP